MHGKQTQTNTLLILEYLVCMTKWISYPSASHPDQQYPVLSDPFIYLTVNLSCVLSRCKIIMWLTVLFDFVNENVILVLILVVLLFCVERENS